MAKIVDANVLLFKPLVGTTAIFRGTPQIRLFDRARYLKHFGVCFIKIGQGNQKLRQFEDQNFNSFFGRAT
jgi:hypothetical protein